MLEVFFLHLFYIYSIFWWGITHLLVYTRGGGGHRILRDENKDERKKEEKSEEEGEKERNQGAKKREQRKK